MRRSVDLGSYGTGRIGGVGEHIRPPADFHHRLDGIVVRIAGEHHVSENVLLESGRHLLHILSLGRTGERREVVVLDEFRAESARTARCACEILRKSRIAQALDVIRRESSLVIRFDLRGCACAIPHAHFGYRPLEESICNAAPFARCHRRGIECTCSACLAADHRRRRKRAVCLEGCVGRIVGHIHTIVVLRILNDMRYAVCRYDGSSHSLDGNAVLVEREACAIVGCREMHPLFRYERGAHHLAVCAVRIAFDARHRLAFGIDCKTEIHANRGIRVG